MAKSDRILKTLTFPIQYLEVGESLSRARGLDVDELYRQCGVDLPRPFMPWQTIDGQQMRLALAYFLSLCPAGPPPLVTFMAHFPLTTHGPVGMMVITSANLGEAIEGTLKYVSLIMPAYDIRRQDVGDEVHLVVAAKYEFGDVADFFTETVLAAFLTVMPFLTQPIAGGEVHVKHAPMGDPAAYEAAFGARFVFGARQNKIVLSRQALHTPLIAPSRASHMLMRATLEQQRQARLDMKPMTQQVKRQLQAAVRQKRVLDAGMLAETLATSPRTLSRRLKEEGSTLPQLRTEVGIEHAEVLLLETDQSIAQIARTTGFADAASFTRAFKRATGQTPTRWRSGATGLI
ncbi:MAG: AraC family transcriptional regulator ligand-binding domain-containing protein [Aquabacterium sp.]